MAKLQKASHRRTIPPTLCMAINPGSGFPFEPFPHFPSFIDDTIPGIRFTAMARMIRLKQPELLGVIPRNNRDEYEDVSKSNAEPDETVDRASPMAIAAKCDGSLLGPTTSLINEDRTYDYQPADHVVRVLLSHYLAFSGRRATDAGIIRVGLALGRLARRFQKGLRIFSIVMARCSWIAKRIWGISTDAKRLLLRKG